MLQEFYAKHDGKECAFRCMAAKYPQERLSCPLDRYLQDRLHDFEKMHHLVVIKAFTKVALFIC